MQLCTYLPRSISRCSFFYGPAPSSLSRLGITTTAPSTQEGLVSDWESYNGQHLPRGMKLIMPSSVHYRAKQSSSTGWEIDRGHCHCPRLGMASLWLSVRYQELRTSVYRTSEGRRWYLWKHSLTSWRKARMGKKRNMRTSRRSQIPEKGRSWRERCIEIPFGTIDETKTKQPNGIGMLDRERIKEKKQRKWKVDRY